MFGGISDSAPIQQVKRPKYALLPRREKLHDEVTKNRQAQQEPHPAFLYPDDLVSRGCLDSVPHVLSRFRAGLLGMKSNLKETGGPDPPIESHLDLQCSFPSYVNGPKPHAGSIATHPLTYLMTACGSAVPLTHQPHTPSHTRFTQCKLHVKCDKHVKVKRKSIGEHG